MQSFEKTKINSIVRFDISENELNKSIFDFQIHCKRALKAKYAIFADWVG